MDYTLQHIIFKLGDNIKDKVKPLTPGFGAYKIYANNADGELLYIGKSGTMHQNGKYGKQNLKMRLTMMQNGLRRQVFFTEQLLQNPDIKQFYIECYIIDEKSDLLPAFLEASFIQEYFNKYHLLPKWNASF